MSIKNHSETQKKFLLLGVFYKALTSSKHTFSPSLDYDRKDMTI